MNGLGLALGALSGAISDTTKGFVESEDERRKVQEEARRNAEDRRREREEGRRAEVHQQQRELFPHQLDAARLGNEEAAQRMDINQGTYEHQQRMWPYDRRTARAQAEVAEAQAHYAFDKARADYDASVTQLRVIQQQLKEAELKYPYLEEELIRQEKEAKQRILLNEDTLTMNAIKIREFQETRDGEAAAEAALRRAGPSLPAVMKVLAEHGRYVHPQNPIVRLLEAQIQAQAQTAGVQNPITALRETRQLLATAQNEAQQEAAASIQAIDPVLAARGGPGLLEMRNWFIQYHLARRLRTSEVPQLGIKFDDKDKAIGSMPQHIVDKLAADPDKVSELVGHPVDSVKARRIYMRMNQYLTDGLEWNDSLRRAAADEFASWEGNPRPSDGWVKDMKLKSSWWDENKPKVSKETRKILDPLFGYSTAESVADRVFGSGEKLPETALPPRAPHEADPEVTKQKRLNEIAQALRGVSLEHLKRNKDTKMLQWLENAYKWEQDHKQDITKQEN